jgi:hypothetical protein
MRLSLSRRSLALLVIGLSAAGVAAAGAPPDHNRFKWHDAAGNLHYSDTLPPDAAKNGYEVVSPRGIIVKRVERAKTSAELAVAKAAAAQAQVERDAAAAHAREDERLISGYPEERDLKRAQRQKLEMLSQQVVAAQISLRSQEQVLADLLGRAAEVERTGKTLPDEQARQLAAMRRQVDGQRAAVERRQAEHDNAGAQFEQETARYRELKAKLAEREPGP